MILSCRICRRSCLSLLTSNRSKCCADRRAPLFGKNTTAGVVSVRTKRPNFEGLNLDASLRVGNFGRTEGRLGFNWPIVDDKLAFRLAAISQQSDGYYKNGKGTLSSR